MHCFLYNKDSIIKIVDFKIIGETIYFHKLAQYCQFTCNEIKNFILNYFYQKYN